ncbi:UNVERIFIED_CONTAM: hypothetical protein FKN15_076515 [Acipenser sinensis]
MADITEDKNKIKSGLIKALKCVETISSAATVINPIFGLAGSIVRIVLHNIDDEEIQTLKKEFKSIHAGLDKISRENQKTLKGIQKVTLDNQYSQIAFKIEKQFQDFKAVVEADQGSKERLKDKFAENFESCGGDSNLHTLYDGVIGKSKVFSKPILKVYMENSNGNRQVMETLCTRLTYLFCIGLIALMGYTAIIEDDEETMSEEWGKNMENVQKEMARVLSECH